MTSFLSSWKSFLVVVKISAQAIEQNLKVALLLEYPHIRQAKTTSEYVACRVSFVEMKII